MGGLEDRAREEARKTEELLAAYEIKKQREQAEKDAAEKAKEPPKQRLSVSFIR